LRTARIVARKAPYNYFCNMKVSLMQYLGGHIVKHPQSSLDNDAAAQLVLCFGNKQVIESQRPFQLLRNIYPAAHIAICSTAGEIFGTSVVDGSLSVAALSFSHTPIAAHTVHINQYPNSYEAGRALLQQFAQEGLRHVLVLSDGSLVNGSELVKGMDEAGNGQLLITGGLAGDGDAFDYTLVGLGREAEKGMVAAIGFYGPAVRIKHGTRGGWETFGLERTVTRSVGNVLFELDDKNALDIYKKYLGAEAAALPSSALLFPLSVTLNINEPPLVRTILAINEKEGSMTFAGDIPPGAKVRFMRANFDKLTVAAVGAANDICNADQRPPALALLISCVGRKLILQGRTEEEVEAVDEIFNRQTLLTGFYSYGEISPFVEGSSCQLHNQTMTITTFDETE
jgi:hypothetical protein